MGRGLFSLAPVCVCLALHSATAFNHVLTSRQRILPPTAAVNKLRVSRAAAWSRNSKRISAVMDPSVVQHAADYMQQDWNSLAAAFHDSHSIFDQGMNLIADAMAGVIDPSEIKSSVAGTGMTKPGWFDGLNLPSIDPWKSWMSFLQLSIFKLREVTGSFGLAIICIVICVKAITYPLNYKVYSAQFEMQAIQPEIERIKEEFKDNPDLINLRTSVLFQEKSVNPLAGCLPVLIQFPIFVGLYRTLLNLGKDRKLEEPFLFLPSLEGPVVAGLPTDYVGVREDAPWLLQVPIPHARRGKTRASGAAAAVRHGAGRGRRAG
jgi:YidC/Oxa1 family membrane protein insertase